MTAVTYEPAHLLTDAFQRNPFASSEEEQEQEDTPCTTADWEAPAASVAVSPPPTASSLPGWFASMAKSLQGQPLFAPPLANPGKWWTSRYLQAELARRKWRKNLRVQLQHFLRDSGLLRAMVDTLVTIGTPALAMEHPDIVPRFLQLSQDCTRIKYGDHDMQGIDMFLPKEVEEPKGLLFFVHGGAWGSGKPWMYRLLAEPFLQKGMAVAVVGYRTFPDGDINDQVNDLERASQELTKRYPHLCLPQCQSDLGVCVMGHSSGAHIAMEMLVNRLLQKQQHTDATQMRIDSFIGISAPYELSSHYEFETMRGLEHISPMKAVCGYDRDRLSEYSPVLRLFQKMDALPRSDRQAIKEACPPVAMIHGTHDDTVPFTSSRQAAKLFSLAGIHKCQEMYLSETGHSDTVLELMLGGKTQDILMDWLLKSNKKEDVSTQGMDASLTREKEMALTTP
ncbi:Probable isoprenylcysteine alpha-carbonyl methylesterase ICMEL1 [Seminavis robusta]|uniref:Probable isoprenylcysteine alpha-carbonyl methylesterase ICMEL1 n=1 Tax=Seminavis robusta TaxID=568900 RepID=A0A9N8HL88_9STRA|nr:Probable isoprenylcysteine alpha-carbonyl methylesterase ICMEL1 [Seminavis robusta]|eukprot:Sro1010_g230900.1 Probable isoprenylcysteine alpha-carbonyl methylesterase ICMEL1 (452) ;mRNA; f:26230-27699